MPVNGPSGGGDQGRAFIDQATEDLHEVGACLDLGHGVLCRHDAAHADDGVAGGQAGTQGADDPVGGLEYGPARETACFFGVGQPLDGLTRERGVGGDDAIDVVTYQCLDDDGNLVSLFILSTSETPPNFLICLNTSPAT